MRNNEILTSNALPVLVYKFRGFRLNTIHNHRIDELKCKSIEDFCLDINVYVTSNFKRNASSSFLFTK